MKRIAALTGAGALLLGMAVPALAGHYRRGSDELTVLNLGVVVNNTETEAETGDNEAGSKGWIMTGNAGAGASVFNDVNYTAVAGCGCYDDVKILNGAFVWNDTETEAETGENEVGGGHHHRRSRGGGMIFTGDAGATSAVSNFVNTTLVGGAIQ